MGINLSEKSIVVTGGGGFLGSYLLDNLASKRSVPRERIFVPRAHEYDLREWENCRRVVRGQEVVFHLAAFVGGIGFNRAHPGRMFYDNMIMGAQLMEAARQEGIEKFITLGTVCAYPKYTPVPFREESIWDGYPEETNAPYGLAKKALLVQAQAYRAQYDFNSIYLVSTNLYGPRDNFNPESSHVIPALIKKVAEAVALGEDSVSVWGTGRASREFIYAQDAAEAIVLGAEHYDGSEPINIGSEMEISIKELVETICRLMKFKGEIVWDSTKPDGQPRRTFDASRARELLGFSASIGFEQGLQKTIDWYQENKNSL